MPFIPQKPNRPKAELKVSIDKEARDEFARYARFLDPQRGDESYAIEGILKKVMQYDREFQQWKTGQSETAAVPIGNGEKVKVA